MSAGKKKTVSLLCITIICVALLAWIGCANPGGGGSSEPTTTTIKGTTLYSSDGGTTTQPANFQFDVPTTVAKGVGARGASSDWIAVTGQIRAGDILINLSGTFNTTTKEFNLRASGYAFTFRIDMTIKGLYTASTGTITQGQTDVAVTDTSTGTTLTFSTSTVKEGQDATKPIADAPTTATPPTAAQTKFWEGVWAGDAVYYFNSDGTPSQTATSIYIKEALSMTCTATQFQQRMAVTGISFPSSWGYTPFSSYQTGTFFEMDESVPNEVVGIIFATQYNDAGAIVEQGYNRIYGTLTSSGDLTGGSFYQHNSDGSDTYTFPTLNAAKTLATIKDTSGRSMVVSRVD